MINLTINNQKAEIEEGANLLQAAEKIGIKIPTLCYHKTLLPYGSCRLCLVEVGEGKRAKLQASCTHPVLEGLIVRTDTERVIKVRKIMLELLLARCPEIEAVKKIAEEWGVKEPRFGKKNSDCILCGLCVRMCRDRMGISAISFTNRGTKREINSPYGAPSEVCQVCGACASICPTGKIRFSERFAYSDKKPRPIWDVHNAGLSVRPPVSILYPQAVPNKAAIDEKRCVHLLRDKCGICQEICQAQAIDYQQKEEKLSIDVGAVVLSSWGEVFNPELKKEYGYGRYPNVISSLQFERILSASGPYSGKVLRPSDKKVPQKVAFIQCVGSRDTEIKYCSSVCCMYATKQAIIAKEHEPDMYLTIFFTDIRAFSKGFEDYHKRARELGVKYVRCRPSAIKEIPGKNDLKIKYQTDRGEIKDGIFDLVVLSVGLQPNSQIKELAQKFGIELNEHDFCWTEPFEPAQTSKVGIYTSGTFTEPKDIPETVMQASAAASKVLELLYDVRGNLIKPKEYPPEKDIAGEEARVGVFVCHCGKNIGGVVNVPEVREYAKTLPNVVYVEDSLYTCSTDTAKKIKEVIERERINRVVVAACSPRTHEVLFQETLKESGLNPYLFEMTNIRDQCSWPHQHEPEKATVKTKDLVRMAVAKARLLEPLYAQKMKINKDVLIVGGGLAGMSAGLSLALRGIKVYLVEKEKELGGNLRKLRFELKGGDPQKKLYRLINDIYQNKNISVYKEAKITETKGSIGKFKTVVSINGAAEELEHGTIIVATGAEEYKPYGEYLYGEDKKVLTQMELEEKLFSAEQKTAGFNSVVMIQCVGARNEQHPYCNRICCSHAIKNALKLKEINPAAKVYILYRDIRTYGFYEPFYRKAREKGILFIRFTEETNPVVSKKDDVYLNVEVKDALLGEKIVINSDYVVLSTGPVPPKGNEEICKLLKIPLSKDEFFLEKHIKLCPCECATPGIFISGLAHYPKFCDETISSAEAAAFMAYKIVGKDERELEARTSFVVDANCDGCAYCVDPCPNDAINLIEYNYDGAVKKTVEVNTSLCEGCGVCMATCPKKGIYVKNFRPDQIMAMVNAALGIME